MGSSSIQFHATPEELRRIINEIKKSSTAQAVLLNSDPFYIIPWSNEPLSTENNLNGVAFVLDQWRPGNSRYEFLMKNPDALILDMGKLTDKGLEESWLSYKTNQEQAERCWKSIIKILKSQTKAGAIAFNPKTGESSVLKSHRYTQGARELTENGVEMLPAAGLTRISFT